MFDLGVALAAVKKPLYRILLLSLLGALFHPVHRVTLSLSQTTTTTTTTTTQAIPSHLVASYPVLSFMYRRLSHHQSIADPAPCPSNPINIQCPLPCSSITFFTAPVCDRRDPGRSDLARVPDLRPPSRFLAFVLSYSFHFSSSLILEKEEGNNNKKQKRRRREIDSKEIEQER
jgi:hypothetical protein